MNIETKAQKIIERIAKANGTTPEVMRSQIEAALEKISEDTSQPHGFMLAELFPDGKPTTDEFVVALEQELYGFLMPKLES